MKPRLGNKSGMRWQASRLDGPRAFRVPRTTRSWPRLGLAVLCASVAVSGCVSAEESDVRAGPRDVLLNGAPVKEGTLRVRTVSSHPASALRPPPVEAARVARVALAKKASEDSQDSADPTLSRALQASLAELALLSGDLDAAERDARALLRLDARDTLARRTLVRAMLTRGRPDEALVLIDAAAVVLGSLDADLLCLQGLAHVRKGMPDAARLAWRKALDKDPAHVAARLNLGALAFANRNVEHAGAAFSRVLELEPRNPDAAVGIALVEAARGKPEAARASLQDLLGHDPRNALALLNLALLEWESLGRPAEAIGYAERYLALGQGDTRVKERLVRLGEEARAQLARAQDVPGSDGIVGESAAPLAPAPTTATARSISQNPLNQMESTESDEGVAE